MIPTDPETLKKLEALAERNIANGDWGDEVTLPGETMPRVPEEHAAKAVVSRVLAHYGVKGMRKGRGKPNRIDRKNGRQPKRLAILYGRRHGVKEPAVIQRATAEQVNQKIGVVNTKYKSADFTDADWGDPSTWSPQTKEYYAEVLALATDSERRVIKEKYGSEPKGKRRAELNETGDRIVIREVKIEHATIDAEEVAAFKIFRDPNGLIVRIEPVEQEEQ